MSEELFISCPYCGEVIIIEAEASDQPIKYVEDCHVCCKPILFTVHYSANGCMVNAERENG